jgi:hypothetical protein
VAQTTNIKIELKGKAKPRSRLGYVVGSEIEVTWELKNLDSRPYPGGELKIRMVPPNQQFVWFDLLVGPINPSQKLVVDNDGHGKPVVTNVLAEGFTLFFAQLQNADIYSPSTPLNQPITKDMSFFSILGKPKEEIYTMVGLGVAAAGLILTSIIGIIQLLHDFHII